MVSTRKNKRCPPGQIQRDAYVSLRRGTLRSRRSYPASCITNRGNPGKGLPSGEPGIGPLRKGDLAKFGYDHVTSMSAPRRHIAIAKAVKAYGALTVFRKLNAVYVYTRNTAPAASRIFKEDRDWVKTKYM
jgi:hypothetical protein